MCLILKQVSVSVVLLLNKKVEVDSMVSIQINILQSLAVLMSQFLFTALHIFVSPRSRTMRQTIDWSATLLRWRSLRRLQPSFTLWIWPGQRDSRERELQGTEPKRASPLTVDWSEPKHTFHSYMTS